MNEFENSLFQNGDYVYTVGELTSEIKDVLELEFGNVVVVGEISGYKVSHAGHAYFALKDEEALLNCAIWKTALRSITTPLKDGLSVEVAGRIDVYPPRGSYQLIVESVTPVGLGDLQKKFEELKKKLQQEGLFDVSRKKPLPVAPSRIAVVTSPTGAAIQDFLKIVRKGYPGLHVQVFPVRVQGTESPREIAHAIDILSSKRLHDIIIVTRGGGSLEDLWAFNEEIVARSIYRCRIPVISAVGHEVDFTISDFVADVRAATPTDAARIIVSRREKLVFRLNELNRRLRSVTGQFLKQHRLEMKRLDEGLRRLWPRRYIDTYRRRLDDRMTSLVERLFRSTDTRRSGLGIARERIVTRVRRNTIARRQELAVLHGKLHALAPTSVFRRGYAVCSDKATGKLVTSPSQVEIGGSISVRVLLGSLDAEVKERYPIEQD